MRLIDWRSGGGAHREGGEDGVGGRSDASAYRVCVVCSTRFYSSIVCNRARCDECVFVVLTRGSVAFSCCVAVLCVDSTDSDEKATRTEEQGKR